MDVSQLYCVFNYCTTADHKSHYSSLSARISCVEISCFSCLSLACRRQKTVFPRMPAKPVRRSGPELPVESQSHCLAAARTLQEFALLFWADPSCTAPGSSCYWKVTAAPVALSASLAARCGNADDRMLAAPVGGPGVSWVSAASVYGCRLVWKRPDITINKTVTVIIQRWANTIVLTLNSCDVKWHKTDWN